VTESANILGVNRAFKRRLALGIALAAVVAGGTVAALAATAPSTRHGTGVPPGIARDLPGAAAYLGVSPLRLQADLRAGKTLAEIAAAASGKSEAGLIATLVAARKARLDAVSAKLTRRVTAEVNRVPGQGARALARSYLGLTPPQLRGELRAGKTLAQIADATSGKSAAGLIAAIVTARQARLVAAVATGKLTRAQSDARAAGLQKRITRLVNRKPHAQKSG
jgi:hypothetical protein